MCRLPVANGGDGPYQRHPDRLALVPRRHRRHRASEDSLHVTIADSPLARDINDIVRAFGWEDLDQDSDTSGDSEDETNVRRGANTHVNHLYDQLCCSTSHGGAGGRDCGSQARPGVNHLGF